MTTSSYPAKRRAKLRVSWKEDGVMVITIQPSVEYKPKQSQRARYSKAYHGVARSPAKVSMIAGLDCGNGATGQTK